MKKTFLGIGAGPIQTGIFVAGAWRGGFDRIVLAEVDPDIVRTVRAAGSITVNTAGQDPATYDRIEIYNPSVPEDAARLEEAAAEAIAVNTALPSPAFYKFAAPYLAPGFARAIAPKYVYASENSTVAASELRKVVGDFPHVHYLDTVIGKMSKVFDASEIEMGSQSPRYTLAPGCAKGHLVEAFNTIYTETAPGIESVGIDGLFPKTDLHPFEEAKLYGHNAAHFVLGERAAWQRLDTMDEAANFPELMGAVRTVLRDECGAALCKKFAGADAFFEPANYARFADELLARMVSPALADSVARVIRDPARKLAWDDRLIGAIRLCHAQGITPTVLLDTAKRIDADWADITRCWPDNTEAAHIKALLNL